ncbi:MULTISPECIES: hypothetical protein [Streptomyces]|nr:MULTISPECIES: hypothetical protein [Streptomyces]
MRFLIAAAFLLLLALAMATVVLGVITALNVAKTDEEEPSR